MKKKLQVVVKTQDTINVPEQTMQEIKEKYRDRLGEDGIAKLYSALSGNVHPDIKIYSAKACMFESHDPADVRGFRSKLGKIVGAYHSIENTKLPFGLHISKIYNEDGTEEFNIATPSKAFAYIIVKWFEKMDRQNHRKIYEKLFEKSDEIVEIIKKYDDIQERQKGFTMLEKQFHISLINAILKRLKTLACQAKDTESDPYITHAIKALKGLFKDLQKNAALSASITKKIQDKYFEEINALSTCTLSVASRSIDILLDRLFNQLANDLKDLSASIQPDITLEQLNTKKNNIQKKLYKHEKNCICHALVSSIRLDQYIPLCLFLMQHNISVNTGIILELLQEMDCIEAMHLILNIMENIRYEGGESTWYSADVTNLEICYDENWFAVIHRLLENSVCDSAFIGYYNYLMNFNSDKLYSDLQKCIV